MRMAGTRERAINLTKVLLSWSTGLDLDIAPIQIGFELTNRCNLRCGFCPNRFRLRPLGNLDPEVFRLVVDQTVSTTLEYHLDMMGEPLLHPGLAGMLEHAGRRGARVVLYTNLSTRDTAQIRMLARSSLNRIIVNLCTDDPEAYREIYGRDALGRVLRNLSLLREVRGANPRPRIVVSWLTLRGLPPRGLPADEVRVLPPHDWLGTPSLKTSVPGRPRPWFRCTRLWASASILWDGRIATCCYDHAGRRILGDLRTATLREVWNSPEMRDLRRHHRSLDPCRGCADPDPQLSFPNLWFILKHWTDGGRRL